MEKQHAQALSLDTYILENTPTRIVNRYHGLLEYAQNNVFGVLDEDVVVLDTETTGFSFNHDELIQIAAARMVKGEITEWYVTFVNPGKRIPEDVAYLTNISDEDVANAPDPDTALEGLVAFVGSSDVVAHNANFDRTFTTKRAAGAALKQNMWIDSLDLARIALPRFTSHRLLDLVRAFGGPESTHRADDDVAATCLVYRALLAAVAAMPLPLVRHISQMSDALTWNTQVVFERMANWMEEQDPEAAGEYDLRAARRALVAAMPAEVRRDANRLNPEEVANAETEEDLAALSTLEFPTEEEIAQAFSSDGMVGSLYPDYEPREEQREMALAVHRAISTSTNLAVEAGTGVGKSMAYLVPMALAAKKNNITVGVATKTNALLDQLVNKELPLLAQATGITYAPLKGFSHYPCLRKVETLVKQGPRVITYKNQEVNQAPALASLLSFVDQSDFDDMDALKLDFRAIPRYRISTKSHECLRRKCPFFGRSCFVHGAREQAQRCDVIVTNHSLMFWDVRFEGGLLPPVRYWAIDEAHGAESEARRAFSLSIASDSLQGLIRRVTGDSAKHNVLLRVERMPQATDEGQRLYNALIAKAHTAAGAFAIAAEEYCLRAKDLLYFDAKTKGKNYEYFDLWLNDEIRASSVYQGVAGCARSLYETLEKLIRGTRDIVAFAEQMEDTSPAQRELALVALELRELYEALDIIFFHTNENNVYSIRLNRNKDTLNEVFTVQPLDVGKSLNESLYEETNSVIYASATLAVDNNFEAFERAVGLNESEASRANTVQVESSYNFNEHMRVYVPTDMPEPNDPAYLPMLQRFLTDLHVAQRGSLLTLFTNRREMEKSFEEVQPELKQEGLRLVCQKWGVSVKGLRDDFLKDEHLSLFALKSFWEGFDAPGSTLKGVVIPKLPFGLPTDPLSCERGQRDDRAWAHYSLPAAVIDVKQAVGRLIRTSTDEGIVVLADHRLISKYYGKKFLNSLPSNNITMATMDEIVAEVRATAESRVHG